MVTYQMFVVVISAALVAANDYYGKTYEVCCWSSDNATQYMLQDPSQWTTKKRNHGIDSVHRNPKAIIHSEPYIPYEFVAIDTNTGSKKWGIKLSLEKEFNSGVACELSADDSIIYVVDNSWDNMTISAIHSGTGTTKWKVSPKYGGIAEFIRGVTNPTFFTMGPSGGCGGFTSLDAETGKLVWYKESLSDVCPRSLLSPDNSTLYIGPGYCISCGLPQSGSVYKISTQTGAQKWQFHNSTANALYVESLNPDGTQLKVHGIQCQREDCRCSDNGDDCLVEGTYLLDAKSGEQIDFTPDKGGKRSRAKNNQYNVK